MSYQIKNRLLLLFACSKRKQLCFTWFFFFSFLFWNVFTMPCTASVVIRLYFGNIYGYNLPILTILFQLLEINIVLCPTELCTCIGRLNSNWIHKKDGMLKYFWWRKELASVNMVDTTAFSTVWHFFSWISKVIHIYSMLE